MYACVPLCPLRVCVVCTCLVMRRYDPHSTTVLSTSHLPLPAVELEHDVRHSKPLLQPLAPPAPDRTQVAQPCTLEIRSVQRWVGSCAPAVIALEELQGRDEEAEAAQFIQDATTGGGDGNGEKGPQKKLRGMLAPSALDGDNEEHVVGYVVDVSLLVFLFFLF